MTAEPITQLFLNGHVICLHLNNVSGWPLIQTDLIPCHCCNCRTFDLLASE